MQQVSLFVLWQSLVVGSYRSFFAHIAANDAFRVGLTAPLAFREAANQLVPCEPFGPPFQAPGGRHPYFILKTWTLHVQAVFFRGLGRALRAFFHADPKPAGGARVFLCVAEPYSLTAIWAWILARVVVGQDLAYLCYSAQNIQKRLPWLLGRIQTFIFKRSAAILVVGQEQEDVLRRHGFSGQTIKFPLWFDESRFHSGAEAARSGLVVGYAGGLTEAKGVLDLLHAFEADPRRLAGVTALRLAGAGPLKAAVEESCARLRAGGVDAQLVGALPTSDMPEFYRSLDILVVPSRTTPAWKEQFGRVIIEAMACGVVVIGSDSGEIPRVVGRADRIFAEGDKAAIARVLAAQVADLHSPARRRLVRSEETARARRKYADSVLAAAFAAKLLEILQGPAFHPQTSPRLGSGHGAAGGLRS